MFIKLVFSLHILQKPSSSVEENGALAENALDTPEHPSPVCVLDASVHRDDTLSPVKQMPNMPTGKVKTSHSYNIKI